MAIGTAFGPFSLSERSIILESASHKKHLGVIRLRNCMASIVGMKHAKVRQLLQEVRVMDYLTLLKWKRQLHGVLLTKDAWKVINGDLEKPTSTDPTNKTFRRDMDKWRKLNNIALGWMLLTLEDYSKQSIDRFNEPLDVMVYLFQKFTPPFMTFDEFIGREAPPRSPQVHTVVVQNMDALLSSPTRASGEQKAVSPCIGRHDELYRQDHNTVHPAPNAGGLEAAQRSPRSPRIPRSSGSPHIPSSPRKHVREEASSDGSRLTKNGIHNIVTRKDLQRGTTQGSNGSGSTIRRHRFVNKITGGKPESPDPDDRLSLTIHRADIVRSDSSDDSADPPSGDELAPTTDGATDAAPRQSTLPDSSIVIPDRNVSLSHSDHVREGPDRRYRSRAGSRPRRSHAPVPKDDGLYMMSGALQDVSRALPCPDFSCIY